ncbi:DUF4229 domain-containing protein [Intrasporangium calvum]|uniref:DUF4229 domain-containing protein n=1 Tax=Intrasporangium calvum TaxID=53358 RepID=UPI000DF61F57|nr:DUF4229 domain-containing protein [Intrasporangium calvum]AXG12458.1 DUF4229 domain-containing protein [Intrasporangium calvum]
MVRYTLLRLLIFFGVLMTLWLVGIRNNPVLLVGLAAILSAVLSYLLLRGMRDEMTAKLMERHEAKLRAKEQGRAGASAFAEDEAAEDAEDEAAEADRAGRTDGSDPSR